MTRIRVIVLGTGAAKLSPEQRVNIAEEAVQGHWNK
jgi:hypothetical protein